MQTFPLWRYLKQRLFDPDQRPILQPQRFQRYVQIRLLEDCWKLQLKRSQEKPQLD